MGPLNRMNHLENFLSLTLLSLLALLVSCTGGLSSSPATDSPSLTPTPTPTPTVTLTCPTGYILVPGSTDLSTTDFCVSVYEMRNVAGSPVSQATSVPWGNVSRNTALAACQSLGTGYDLIANSQWQTLARNIAAVASNWSSGSVANGYMNIGNADGWGTMSCDSTLEYVDPSCSAVAAGGNFILKRTHTLSNGNVIWDLGGNHYELMKELSTAGQYGLGGCATDLTAVNPANDALGTAQDAFGIAPISGMSLDTASFGCAGMGGLIGTNSNNSVTNRAVLRGGSFYDQSGIFNADIGWAQATDADGSFSFRCVYQ